MLVVAVARVTVADTGGRGLPGLGAVVCCCCITGQITFTAPAAGTHILTNAQFDIPTECSKTYLVDQEA